MQGFFSASCNVNMFKYTELLMGAKEKQIGSQPEMQTMFEVKMKLAE